MITFRKVKETDEQLNTQIDELNRKVFPSAETTANLHFLAGLYKGTSVDFIAIEDDLDITLTSDILYLATTEIK